MKTIQLIYLTVLYLLLASCSEDSAVPNMRTESGGKGGSMARFTVSGNHLYTVDNWNLKVFDLATPATPSQVGSVRLGWGVETIFPYQQKLFIGTETGMIVYDIKNPSQPQYLTEVRHVYSCDPVVVQGNYAYITLHSEAGRCGRFTNELQIIDITNIDQTYIVNQYDMLKPLGLGVDGNLLFVCDDGIKVFDITNKKDLVQLHHFKINAYDVIPNNGILTVTGKDGIKQYRYGNGELELLSSIGVGK